MVLIIKKVVTLATRSHFWCLILKNILKIIFLTTHLRNRPFAGTHSLSLKDVGVIVVDVVVDNWSWMLDLARMKFEALLHPIVTVFVKSGLESLIFSFQHFNLLISSSKFMFPI